MTATFSIQALSASIDRKEFSCGIMELDRYFREQVTQDMKRRVSNCFVALDHNGVAAGYYTLAATSLPLTDLSPGDAKRLPRYPLLPAALVGRLAVDLRYQRLGLGASLIVDALRRSWRSESAIYALIVDAKDAKALEFYLHLGFQPFTSQPQRLFLAIAKAAQRLEVT